MERGKRQMGEFNEAIARMRAAGCLHPEVELKLRLGEIDPRIEITPVSLEFPDDITREAWLEVGRALAAYAVATRQEDLFRKPRKRRRA
jgi:hypothetical protein